MQPHKFSLTQAEEIAAAFSRESVDYLFIGKSAAIILGFPSTTQDVDLYIPKSRENAERIIAALTSIGFTIEDELAEGILAGKDFIQIKTGPFDLDLVHAPDGITDYETAKSRSVKEGDFRVVCIDDIIASKRASGREKDIADLPLLEDFRVAYINAHPKPLKSAIDAAKEKPSANST